MSTPIVFIDTETTSLADDREIWEVGMISGQAEYQTFIDVNLERANPVSLKIGKFYERHPLGRYLSGASGITRVENDIPSQSRVAHEVARWTHGAHIVGAVPSFDMEALAKLLRRHGLTPAWHYHLIDIESMALGWLRARGGPWWQHSDIQEILPWRFDDLLEACDVPLLSEENKHTALGDARKVRELWGRITGGPA